MSHSMTAGKRALTALAVALAMATTAVQAAVSEQDAQALGATLTPLGGEKAGNADGSIPAWTGGLTQAPAGFTPGKHYVDPFPDDKPLFTITAENVAQYQDKLTPGQVALLKTYPGSLNFPVYQSRRTAAAPDWVYDNTRKNATSARLLNNGNGFADAYGGIPFPIPQTGVEAVWNHIARYRGTHLVRIVSEATIQANGSFALSKHNQQVLFKYYVPGGNYADLKNLMFYYYGAALSPARIAGQASLVYETLDQVAEPRMAWGYVPGARRVRRAPTLSYDTPDDGSDSLLTVDDRDLFNGSPDRYEWKLVGKREMYIPYNNYRISSPSVSYKELIQPGHLNPAHTRFELHRVWVVEGTLKDSARHVYSKRTFFLDEDSWQIAVADEYDGRGELWRVSVGYLTNFYDLPTIWSAVDAFHDLQSRRYVVHKLENEEKTTIDFTQPIPADDFFKPSGLQRRGTR